MTQPQEASLLGCKVTRSRTTKIRAFLEGGGWWTFLPAVTPWPPSKAARGALSSDKNKTWWGSPQEWNTFFLCLNFYRKI